MSNVRQFGAAGDGATDDTDAIRHALDQGDGILEFPPGLYRLRETIEIDLDRTGPAAIVGGHGTCRIIMAGSGPAFRLVGHHEGTADPPSITPDVWARERFPVVSGLEISGEHEEADGLELICTMQATIERVLIRRVRHGIRLAERNRNLLLNACHIYNNSGIGVYFDRCNLHQAIISACHISYNRQAGIRFQGGDVHNVQITGNDVEYNYQEGEAGAADIWLDAADGVASEITISGNTIQARVSPGGCNLRITGQAATPHAARLIAVTGNVIGSQETNIEIAYADRVAISGNTIYDGKLLAIRAQNAKNLSIADNTFGWEHDLKREMANGIRLEDCDAANLLGLILPESQAGSESQGGAIEFIRTTDSGLIQCQILDPLWRGIVLQDCRRVRISDSSIVDRRDPPTMLSAVEVTGGAENLIQGLLVKGATVEAVRCPGESGGTQGNIVF